MEELGKDGTARFGGRAILQLSCRPKGWSMPSQTSKTLQPFPALKISNDKYRESLENGSLKKRLILCTTLLSIDSKDAKWLAGLAVGGSTHFTPNWSIIQCSKRQMEASNFCSQSLMFTHECFMLERWNQRREIRFLMLFEIFSKSLNRSSWLPIQRLNFIMPTCAGCSKSRPCVPRPCCSLQCVFPGHLPSVSSSLLVMAGLFDLSE